MTKPPKTADLKANVPTVRSAKLPAVRQENYTDFDDWHAAGQIVLAHIDATLRNDDVAALERALEQTQSNYLRRVWRVFEDGWEFFNRDEFYEKRASPAHLHWDTRCDYRGLRQHVVNRMFSLALVTINQEPKGGKEYGRALVKEILAVNPSAPALEATCREIRRTFTFLPSAAELLKILRRQMEHWTELQQTDSIEQWRAELARRINSAKAELTAQRKQITVEHAVSGASHEQSCKGH